MKIEILANNVRMSPPRLAPEKCRRETGDFNPGKRRPNRLDHRLWAICGGVWLGMFILCAGRADSAALPGPGVRPSNWVEIRQGTAAEGPGDSIKISHGTTLPLVGSPWGFTDGSVQTTGGVTQRKFFDPNTDDFAGIRATHQPSFWIADHGQMLILPQVGPLLLDEKNRLTTYDRPTAVFQPAYVSVTLPQARVRVELTATAHGAIFRFTFDAGAKTGRILLNPAGLATMDFAASAFRATSSYRRSAPENFKTYYFGELDRPMVKSAGIPSQTPKGGRANSPTGYFEFDVTGKPVVELKIGSSLVSFEQAQQNLKAELSGGFDAVRLASTAQWDAQLSRIKVEGTAEQKKTFYSCLYRALKFPHRLDEITATGKRIHYSPWDGQVHDGPAYTDSGLWDTYRTQFPLLSLVWPDQLGDICAGWLNAYHEADWLPNWPHPGGLNGMTGTHIDIMFADAMVKNVTGFDYDDAYAAIRKDSFEGREKLNGYLEKGYVFQTQKRKGFGVSDTFDYCYDDWAVAQAARLTHHPEDALTLEKRATGYRNLWDPAVGMMRPKSADGQWFDKTFDPFAWGRAYCEGGPWQYIYSAPFDVAGLEKLSGGNDAMTAKLDQLFSLPPTFHRGGYGGEIHEMTEMPPCQMGQCALNNQPSFHLPYLYAAIGRPWQTEYWTRRACRTLFKPEPQGFPGDEDNGSMASWYLLSSMGIYPLTPGCPQYVLTSPLFQQVVLHLPQGKTFTINAPGNSDDAIYVQSRKLNGKAYSPVWIGQQAIVNGGTMEVVTGTEPVKQVATGNDLPYSLSREQEAGK